MASAASLRIVATVMLSAYTTNFIGKGKVVLSKSCASRFHRKGDKTPPCGHPICIDCFKQPPLIEMRAFLFERKLSTVLIR